MGKTFLFFDVECANCFDGIGKMCSFGTVLTDEHFSVIERADIVMNPESEFDWYLFKNKNDIQLAYPENYFFAQPPFPAFYDRIADMLTAPERILFTFGAMNDVGFIVSACERYGKRIPDFFTYDVERITKKDGTASGGLEKRCAALGISLSGLKAHRSCDDAFMTMKLLESFCAAENKDVHSILTENSLSRISTAQYIRHRKNRLKKKEKQRLFAQRRAQTRSAQQNQPDEIILQADD